MPTSSVTNAGRAKLPLKCIWHYDCIRFFEVVFDEADNLRTTEKTLQLNAGKGREKLGGTCQNSFGVVLNEAYICAINPQTSRAVLMRMSDEAVVHVSQREQPRPVLFLLSVFED